MRNSLINFYTRNAGFKSYPPKARILVNALVFCYHLLFYCFLLPPDFTCLTPEEQIPYVLLPSESTMRKTRVNRDKCDFHTNAGASLWNFKWHNFLPCWWFHSTACAWQVDLITSLQILYNFLKKGTTCSEKSTVLWLLSQFRALII